jgi:hypothetical protein
MTGILTPAAGPKTCQVYGVGHVKAGVGRQEEAAR